MAYTVVPVDINETFSVSQPKITANFAAINTVVSVDHETFDSANQGKHKQVTLNAQAAHPGTAATEVKLYSKNNDAGNPSLWFQPYNVAATTAGIDFTTYLANGNGWAKLPCGLIMKWGNSTIAAGSQVSGAVAFAGTVANAFTTVYSVQVTPYNAPSGDARDSILHVTNVAAASFTVTRTNTYKGTIIYFYYLAIGV